MEINSILQGDAVTVLKGLDAGVINTCITSPPYYGLRDYGVAGQIGLEETPEQYISKLVEVFREVRRVLRDDGTCWVNIGDSYCNTNGYARAQPKFQRQGRNDAPANDRDLTQLHKAGFKTKDLIGIPWMLAFALRADGWYLRQDIIWAKPNPMPESVTDRCTKSHEYIFLLSKSKQYYYDNKAIMEPASYGEEHANKVTSWGTNRKHPNKANVADYAFIGDNHTTSKMKDGSYGRNKRDVWTVTTKPYTEAHFATFPKELIEPCVRAGAPAGGVVLDPFMGSGTTAVVALQNNRRFVGIELNPAYINIAEKRIKQEGYYQFSALDYIFEPVVQEMEGA